MIYVKDATGNTSTDDKNFMSQHSPLACTWHYSDQQSGVMGYEVAVASYEDAALAGCRTPAARKPGGTATGVGDACMLATGDGCGIRKNTDCVYLPLHLFESVEKVPGKATARRNFPLNDVNMTHGKHYFCVVRAFNGAGLPTVAASNGFVFDSTPAVCTGVRDGLVIDTNFSNSLTTVFGSWDCHDPESGATLLYSWQLYNVETGAAYFPYAFVGSMDRAVKTQLAIENGDRVAVRYHLPRCHYLPLISMNLTKFMILPAIHSGAGSSHEHGPGGQGVRLGCDDGRRHAARDGADPDALRRRSADHPRRVGLCGRRERGGWLRA
jgi:hypothetical protein